jgi:hypothetical protein
VEPAPLALLPRLVQFALHADRSAQHAGELVAGGERHARPRHAVARGNDRGRSARKLHLEQASQHAQGREAEGPQHHRPPAALLVERGDAVAVQPHTEVADQLLPLEQRQQRQVVAPAGQAARAALEARTRRQSEQRRGRRLAACLAGCLARHDPPMTLVPVENHLPIEALSNDEFIHRDRP